MASPAKPTVPWSLSDARTAFLAHALGFGLLVWAWLESSGTGRVARQTTWTVVGIFAVAVMAAGDLFWVLPGRRTVRGRRDELIGRISDLDVLAAPDRHDDAAGDGPVALSGSTRYHRGDCLLVRGKDVHAVRLGSRSAARLRPCEMCEP